MKKVSVILLCFLCLVFSAQATDYYFSATGSDISGNGTIGSPYQTIGKVSQISLLAGDKVLFKRGDTFFGSLVFNRSGNSTQPVTFGAYGTGAKPVISGFITVTSWTDLGNGIYESNTLSTGSSVNMVVIDGKEYAKGRYPNLDNGNGGYLQFESHTSNTITDNQIPVNNTWSNAEIAVRTKHFALDIGRIDTIIGNTITFNNSTFHYTISANNYGYFLQDDIKTLDQFGEWYYNPTTKKIDVYFGNNAPANYTVQVSAKDVLIEPQNKYFTIRDIAFAGANTYAIWNNWSGFNDLKFINCSFSFSGIDAIFLAGKTNITIDSCTFDYNNSSAISIGYHNVNCIVSNSNINHTALFHGMMITDDLDRQGYGIFHTSLPGVQGLTCINNIIKNTGYTGVFFAGDNNLIQNNFIDSSCTVLDDGGGIYTGNFTGAGQTPVVNVNNRILYNISDHAIGAAIGAGGVDWMAHSFYLDDNGNNISVIGNTGANSGLSGIYIHNANNYIIQNNVFYNNSKEQMYWQDDGLGGYIYNGDVQGNMLFATTASQYILYMGSDDNNFADYLSISNNNYYCSPFHENQIVYTNWFGHSSTFYDLPGWQNAYTNDLNTNKTPVALTDINNVFFKYNATNSPITVQLNGTYIELDHTIHNSGNITIQPFSSVLLIKTSSTVPKKKKYNKFKGNFGIIRLL